MAELPSFDPYEVLGVDKDADANSIKKSYRKLALLKHPDKCGADEELKKLRTDEFQRLNEAYDILGDDDNRQRHDALVKLEALRREKASMGGGAPRPFTRASTFSTAYPGATTTTYTSRGATNVEDRAPRGYYEADDMYSIPRRDFDYGRRAAPRPDRTRERDEEVRRAERRREAEERRAADKEARAREWEEQKRARDEQERARKAQEDPLRYKYDEMVENHRAYTRPGEVRPTLGRRSSTRESPRPPYMARRSRASPKEREMEEERSRERFEREQRTLEELRAREAEKERMRAKEAENARLRAEAEVAERAKAELAERARQERQKEKELEKERQRQAARLADEQKLELEREERLKKHEAKLNNQRANQYPNLSFRDETVRRPSMQHSNSSPPILADEPSESIPYRSRAERTTSSTKPSSASRRETQVPKQSPSHPVHGDSGYSSSGSTGAKPSKTTTYRYPEVVESPKYRVQTREPTSARRTSPTTYASEHPTAQTATKMANLAPSSNRRPTTSHGAASRPVPFATSSSHRVPRARSPDRSQRRRDAEREYARGSNLMYGERAPSGYAESRYGNPEYSTYGNTQYSTRPGSRRSHEADPYPYGSSSGYYGASRHTAAVN